jgi:hypothetical protein
VAAWSGGLGTGAQRALGRRVRRACGHQADTAQAVAGVEAREACGVRLGRGGIDHGEVLVAVAILGASGWLGGKLAYHYGVRVADEHTQAEGFS